MTKLCLYLVFWLYCSDRQILNNLIIKHQISCHLSCQSGETPGRDESVYERSAIGIREFEYGSSIEGHCLKNKKSGFQLGHSIPTVSIPRSRKYRTSWVTPVPPSHSRSRLQDGVTQGHSTSQGHSGLLWHLRVILTLQGHSGPLWNLVVIWVWSVHVCAIWWLRDWYLKVTPELWSLLDRLQPLWITWGHSSSSGQLEATTMPRGHFGWLQNHGITFQDGVSQGHFSFSKLFKVTLAPRGYSGSSRPLRATLELWCYDITQGHFGTSLSFGCN
jgi:hypothetical protein